MSRLAGFFDTAGRGDLGEVELANALGAMPAQRGDVPCTWLGGGEIGLGLSATRGLPAHRGQLDAICCDALGAAVVAGEIYNVSEIRAELDDEKEHLGGDSIGHVVRAACRHWGIAEALGRFNGIFALAVWDAQTGTVTLARDHMGVKPLAYSWNGRALTFGSDLRALRAFGGWEPRLDPSALADFFRFAYIAEPLSVYQGVCKLPPGHLLQLRRGSQPTLHKYFSISDTDRVREPAESDGAVGDRLEALIANACKLRVAGSAPVGVFLSGGVDSSLVAALMQRDLGAVHTFTIGFDDPRYDEAHHAEQVARHLGTAHRTLVVSENDAAGVVPDWAELFDEPFGDYSGVPTFLAARMAREHVPAVMMADGADELFGTYDMYESVYRRMHAASFGSGVGPLARAIAAALPWDRLDGIVARRPAHADPGLSRTRKLTSHFSYLQQASACSTAGHYFEFAQYASNWHGRALDRLLGRTVSDTRRHSIEYPGVPLDQMRLWELDHYTAADVLTKVDRATGAAGLIAREPLLDPRIVTLSLTLPERMRRGPLGAKQLLRSVLYRHVPQKLIERPKMGFTPPIGRWMDGALRPLLQQHLNDSRVRTQGVLCPETVRSTLRRFAAGDKTSTHRVWLLLAFQMWYSRWMESSVAARPLPLATHAPTVRKVAA